MGHLPTRDHTNVLRGPLQSIPDHRLLSTSSSQSQKPSLFPGIGYDTFPAHDSLLGIHLLLISQSHIQTSPSRATLNHLSPGGRGGGAWKGNKTFAHTSITSIISSVSCYPHYMLCLPTTMSCLREGGSSLYFQHLVPIMLLKCKYVGERIHWANNIH